VQGFLTEAPFLRLMLACSPSLTERENMNEQKQTIRIVRTQKAYDVLSPSNLLHHRFVTFLQCKFLGLQNIDGSIMQNIDDISQLLGILEWEVVDYEPTESRWAELYENRKTKYSGAWCRRAGWRTQNIYIIMEYERTNVLYLLHSIVIGMDIRFASQWI
jgi:hypothetical protein